MVAQTPNSQRLENKRDPEENPRSLCPVRFALATAGVPGLGASPGVGVIERLDLERAVEALHRGIIVAVSRSRETLNQAHAVGRIPECLSSVDTAAVTVEHRSQSQAST